MSVSDNLLFFLCLSDRGGAEISMVRVAQGLVLSGRSVTLMAYGTMPFLAREWGFSGEVIELKRKRTASAFFPLYSLLRKRRFAAIVSALTHTNMAAILAATLSLRNTHVIATEHGSDGLMACASSRFFMRMVRFIYQRAALIITVSKALEQKWRKILTSDVWVRTVYNPVVDENLSEPQTPAHPWLLQQEPPVIIGIGRLKREKNFSLLLRAFAQALPQKEARLVILGEGEERRALEGLAHELGVKEKILFPGFVADIRPWLQYAALLACPSTREGFGNVIVEALACGVAVVSTDCPGPAEILENGRYGRLTPLEDAAALAKAIGDSLRQKQDKTSLRGRAQDFTVARCVDDYAALIDTLGS